MPQFCVHDHLVSLYWHRFLSFVCVYIYIYIYKSFISKRFDKSKALKCWAAEYFENYQNKSYLKKNLCR